MTQFIHLADAKQIAAIRRSGIAARKIRGEELRGFYCTPVTRNGFRTHQWLRELKRRGIKTYEAIQFYLPARTEVYIGRYGQPHLKVTASKALKIFEEHESGLGLEVIVPRPLTQKKSAAPTSPTQSPAGAFLQKPKANHPSAAASGATEARSRHGD